MLSKMLGNLAMTSLSIRDRVFIVKLAKLVLEFQ